MKIFLITDMKNYYYILGVHSNATIKEIKSAFRKLAIRLHPDKNYGDKFFEERFKDIKGAYETLSDDLRKSDYDIQSSGIIPAVLTMMLSKNIRNC